MEGWLQDNLLAVFMFLIAMVTLLRKGNRDSKENASRLERIDVNVMTIISRLDKMEERQGGIEEREGALEVRVSLVEQRVKRLEQTLDSIEKGC